MDCRCILEYLDVIMMICDKINILLHPIFLTDKMKIFP